MKEKFFLLLLSILLLLVACSSKSSNTKNQKSNEVNVEIGLPKFSADSAYSYIQAQCDFGPRVPGSEAHGRCLDYFVNFFQSHDADTVIVQRAEGMLYDGTKKPIRNVVAVYNVEAENRIMFCAHWDSRVFADNDPNPKLQRIPILGAGDGASGVGVLMEVARILSANPTNIGIDIILFDLEDWGAPEWAESVATTQYGGWCLGSEYWAKSPHIPGYQAQYAVLLDMVAASDAQFYHEYYSLKYAPWLVDKVWTRAEQLGFSERFINKPGGAVVDDHLPVNEISGIPCINIVHYNPYTESGFGDFWHTHADDMRNVDMNTLYQVGTLVVNLIYRTS